MTTGYDLQMNTRLTDEDQVQLRTYVERLQREAVHVALIGRDPVSVDEQGRRLVQSLRQDAGLEVVVLFDAEEDTLIGRINQRLASLSLDQARHAGNAREPLQIWVIQIQSDAQVRQAQMLARMVRDLPAVNLRLITLMTPLLSRTLLDDPVGRSFVPWRLPESVPLDSDEDNQLQDPVPQTKAMPSVPPTSTETAPAPRPLLLARLRERWRYPPDPVMVAAIAVGLLLLSLLVSYI